VLYGLLHNDFVLRLGLAFLTALVVSLVVGAWLIRFFRKKNVIEDTTQPDHAGLNAIQSQKKNVPTMGGLMILAGIVVATLICSDIRFAPQEVCNIMLVLFVLGGAGFADDYIKLKHKPSRGLTKTQKLAIQFVLGGIVGYLLFHTDPAGVGGFCLGPQVRWEFGWLFIPWSSFIMAATSNAVNLTDGLDGLAGGLTLIASITIGLLSFRFGMGNIAILCLAIAGAVLGFLYYNKHPAQIFMGDTGSLALGGLLAYAALAWRAEFLLLVIGAVFFIEELTVALQIAGFMLTKKRIFPITPIHHYFQVYLKWSEKKIVYLAWVLGLVAAVAGSMILAKAVLNEAN